MSIRAPLRALYVATRVSTASSSQHSIASSSTLCSAFSKLNIARSITTSSSNAASPSSSSSSPAGFSASQPPSVIQPVDPLIAPRGYSPLAIPPLVDPILDLFTNLLMRHGKKGEAQRRVAHILELIQKTTNQPPVALLHRAVYMAGPAVKVISIKKSIKTTPAPRPMFERQRVRQAIIWIFKAADPGRKGGIPREVRIAREILRVLEGESQVFKWLEERHKAAALARSNIKYR
ncbi:ribosomal protein S7 domain-containing protein [Naematelia encephala]|uniref:Ribosomal protein S7 domain-containing protein n=1 Tax=Naematelia encephala TaxID=71784 RepID=A0A1Y2AXZ2_9TREE|nr:ribosomal protein S7 domain-containing protein [Naematelia encephala]